MPLPVRHPTRSTVAVTTLTGAPGLSIVRAVITTLVGSVGTRLPAGYRARPFEDADREAIVATHDTRRSCGRPQPPG